MISVLDLSANFPPVSLGVLGVGSLETHDIWNLWTRSPTVCLCGVSGWYYGLHVNGVCSCR